MPPPTLKDVRQVGGWVSYEELVLVMKEWEIFYRKASKEGNKEARLTRRDNAAFINYFLHNGKGDTDRSKQD